MPPALAGELSARFAGQFGCFYAPERDMFTSSLAAVVSNKTGTGRAGRPALILSAPRSSAWLAELRGAIQDAAAELSTITAEQATASGYDSETAAAIRGKAAAFAAEFGQPGGRWPICDHLGKPGNALIAVGWQRGVEPTYNELFVAPDGTRKMLPPKADVESICRGHHVKARIQLALFCPMGRSESQFAATLSVQSSTLVRSSVQPAVVSVDDAELAAVLGLPTAA